VVPYRIRGGPGLFPIPARGTVTKTYAMSTFGDTTGQDTRTAQDNTPQDNTVRDNTARDNTGQSRSDYAQGPRGPRGPWGPLGRAPLRRAYDGRMIAGVCAGIGDYLNIDITIVRVAFAVFTFVGGIGIPAYLACLLLIPEEGSDQSIAGTLIDSVQHGL
jgi:phage shock protein C